MPAPDDDLFSRMLSSFFLRQTRNKSHNHPSTARARLPHIDFHWTNLTKSPLISTIKTSINLPITTIGNYTTATYIHSIPIPYSQCFQRHCARDTNSIINILHIATILAVNQSRNAIWISIVFLCRFSHGSDSANVARTPPSSASAKTGAPVKSFSCKNWTHVFAQKSFSRIIRRPSRKYCVCLGASVADDFRARSDWMIHVRVRTKMSLSPHFWDVKSLQCIFFAFVRHYWKQLKSAPIPSLNPLQFLWFC